MLEQVGQLKHLRYQFVASQALYGTCASRIAPCLSNLTFMAPSALVCHRAIVWGSTLPALVRAWNHFWCGWQIDSWLLFPAATDLHVNDAHAFCSFSWRLCNINIYLGGIHGVHPLAILNCKHASKVLSWKSATRGVAFDVGTFQARDGWFSL